MEEEGFFDQMMTGTGAEQNYDLWTPHATHGEKLSS